MLGKLSEQLKSVGRTGGVRALGWLDARAGGMTAAALLAIGVVMIGSAGEAWAADGFGGYVSNVFGKFDLSGSFPNFALFGGGFGALISGYKLYEGLQDGGRLGDNKSAVLGLAATTPLLSYGAFKTALVTTGAGS